MESAVAELVSESAAAQQTTEAFQRVKPVCSQLLYRRADPQLLLQCLKDLHAAIAGVSSRGLARCYDYITYPLLLMIDCIAVTRSQPAGSNGTSSGADGIAVPAMKTDRVAEAVLDCMLLLLERIGSSLESDQVLLLLQRLVAVLQLTPQQATEEIRLKSLNTLAAALQPPSPQRHQQQHPHPLSRPSTAPLTGVIITHCLAAAAAEVSAGSSGSRAVVHAAIRALQAVVTAVGPGAGLSFFLPGLASGLTKQLLAAAPAASGPPATGAAAGSTTVVLVLQLLTQVINMTLGDYAVQHVPTPGSTQQQTPQQGPAEDSNSCVNSVPGALVMLQQLSVQAAESHIPHQQQQQQQPSDEQHESSRHFPREGRPVQQQQQQLNANKELTVQQTPEWLVSSSSKVQSLLAMTLPRLLAHSQPAVRAAVAAAAADLLQQCNRSLQNSRQALLEILLTLATDDYDEVSHVAVGYLQQCGAAVAVQNSDIVHTAATANGQSSPTAAAAATAHSPMSKSAAARRIAAAARQASAAGAVRSSALATAATDSSSSSGVPGDLALTLCLEVAAAVRRSCAAGTVAAKRAAAALLCTSPNILYLNIFKKPHAVSQLCDALIATFQLDPSSAALLLRATAAARGGDVVSGSAMAAAADGSGGITPRTAATSAKSCVSYPVLPRMPLSLKYLISNDSYRAAAAVARALGRCARVVDSTQQQQQQQQQQQLQADCQGGALQVLVDHLLALMSTAATPNRQQQQQQQQQASSSSSSSKQLAAIPGAGDWQCQIAAVVIVITEVIFGASASWQAPIKQIGISATTSSNMQLQQPVSDMDSCYESVLLSVTTAVTACKLWGLPTSNSGMLDTAGAVGSAEQQLPAQVLGANALLLHALIDCVGTAARCAGQHFSSNTKLLRAALLPLLERMADPCPLVAAAAAGALDSICQHSGYSLGISQLVGDNADYIVDGVCKKLRNLPANPRAPQLLSVLLHHAGVGQQIIPLLAEPLRAALSGVSILARKQQPGYTLPFLHVLQSVGAGAAAEAATSQKFFRNKLAEVVAAATAAGLFETPEDEESGSLCGSDGADHGPATAGDGSAAARYFRKHLEQKAAADTQVQQQQQHLGLKGTSQSMSQQSAEDAMSPPAAAGAAMTAAVDIDLDNIPALPPGKKVLPTSSDLEDIELAWRRAYSAASLASAAVEAAKPLVMQRNLRLAVLAVSVLTVALEALAAATDAIDTEERMFDLLIDRPRDAALKPARPAVVKLLPAVHGIWPLLLACLQDTGSVALIEQGLQLLSHMVKLAGGRFLARRFKQEAWPLLVRLLKQGPQAGATALAAATSVSSTGGGAAAAALLGIGAGPGSELPNSGGKGIGSSSSGSGGLGIMQTALRTLGAAAAGGSTSWNAAQGSMVNSETYLQETGGLAPASLQRVRLAVLSCLQEICSDSSAAFVVQGSLVWELCVLTVPYLADSQPLALREAAGKLLVSAAQVDADTVWLVLVDLASCYTDISQLLAQYDRVEVGKDGCAHSKVEGGEPATPDSTAESAAAAAAAEAVNRADAGSAAKGDHIVLPKLQQLLPRVSAAAGPAGSESGGLQKLLRSSEGASCGKRAAALLQLIAKQRSHVGWPAKAEQQLEQIPLSKVL